jgi:hypothetical protein
MDDSDSDSNGVESRNKLNTKMIRYRYNYITL